MCPTAQTDGHDSPRFFGEAVPGEAALVKDVGVGLEDAVGQPDVAQGHGLPSLKKAIQTAFRTSISSEYRRQSPPFCYDALRRTYQCGVVVDTRQSQESSPFS